LLTTFGAGALSTDIDTAVPDILPADTGRTANAGVGVTDLRIVLVCTEINPPHYSVQFNRIHQMKTAYLRLAELSLRLAGNLDVQLFL
jgi:hypothetical protein